MRLAKKDILDMESLSVEEIQTVLDTAETLKEISTRPIKKVPTLRGKTIIHFFYEPSARTRTSFEIAAKRLSADTVGISASTSSIEKDLEFDQAANGMIGLETSLPLSLHLK